MGREGGERILAGINAGGDEVTLRQFRFHCGGVATSADSFIYIRPFVFSVYNYAENVPTASVGRCVSTDNADRPNATTKKPVRIANISADISSTKCCQQDSLIRLLESVNILCAFFNNTLWET